MAQLSFRDRFLSPPVAQALTSPTAILATGAGAAVGIVATISAAPVVLPVAAVAGAAIGLAGRLAIALPRKGRGEPIRPKTVDEPWRGQVEDAVRAQTRFGDAIKVFRPGPMRDAMVDNSTQVEEAVSECWRVARQGQIVSEARAQINDREINWELQRAEHTAGSVTANETRAQTIASLQSQQATAARMDAVIGSARDQLGLLNARLDESVTRAIELSVSSRLDDAASLGNDVGAIVGDLEALRRAIEDVDEVERTEVDDVPERPGRRASGQ